MSGPQGNPSEDERSLNPLAIAKELHLGGSWLGVAREFVQRHCVGGDTVIWGSNTPMTLTMKEIEDMALSIAVAAIKHERSKRRG